jgi:hypothetical protein
MDGGTRTVRPAEGRPAIVTGCAGVSCPVTLVGWRVGLGPRDRAPPPRRRDRYSTSTVTQLGACVKCRASARLVASKREPQIGGNGRLLVESSGQVRTGVSAVDVAHGHEARARSALAVSLARFGRGWCPVLCGDSLPVYAPWRSPRGFAGVVPGIIQTSCVRVEGLNWARGPGGSVGVGVEGQPVAGGERWRWGLTACVLVYYYSDTAFGSLEKSRWTYTWTRTVRPRSAGRGRSPSRTSSRVAASRGARHGRHPGAGRFLGNQPQRGDARHQGSQAKRVPAAPRPSGGAAAVVQERPGLDAPWRGRRSGQHARGVVTS